MATAPARRKGSATRGRPKKVAGARRAAGRTPGRPAANGADQQVRIIDAALACYVRKGIGATSIRDVASGAGVTPALVHYYFGDARQLMEQVMAQRLMPVFDNAGIGGRYSCVPLDWYERDHDWPERSALYVENAVALLERAARDCLARAACPIDAVDAIVTVSTTGIATPSLDALLMERLAFRRDVERLPIFGLGCTGGVLGLSRAAALARADPGTPRRL